MKNKVHPQLTLIGAGPGDPELITLKGIKSLRKSKVVLYDALVDKSLLEHAPDAIHIFVGKRVGRHSFTQEAIQQLIIEYAYTYGHVVRLKGGDPFLFGRGMEEIEHARLFGINTEVVPGISSAFSVPAASGIPVTQRGLSDGVWVITGTKSDRSMSRDIALAAKSNSTVVILMGTRKLSDIVGAFRIAGKKHLPVGIIQNGTTDQERSVFGEVANIEYLAKEAKIKAPAIIVLGEVVKNKKKTFQLVNQQIRLN